MAYVDTDGAYTLMPRVNPYFELRELAKIDPEPATAVEMAEGELRVGEQSRNRGTRWQGCGPSLAQVLEAGDD